MIDVSAVLLNAITVFFSFWIASVVYRIGRVTGFVSFWKKVTKGWILVGIGRILMLVSAAEIWTDPNALFDMRDAGLTVILVAVLFMLWGFIGFLKEMTERS